MRDVKVVQVDRVEVHPDPESTLTVNHLSNGAVGVSNRQDDGSQRYQPGDVLIHVPPDNIAPEWLLRRQDCWDEAKGKGRLGGSKGNRVKARKFGDIVSEGMLLACRQVDGQWSYEGPDGPLVVEVGQDVREALGIGEYKAP